MSQSCPAGDGKLEFRISGVGLGFRAVLSSSNVPDLEFRISGVGLGGFRIEGLSLSPYFRP